MSALGARALAVLDDSSREFAASDYVELEVMPKARFHKSIEEIRLYEAYLNKAVIRLPFAAEDGRSAYDLACRLGLSAFDALHLVAARKAGCTEFITSERPTSPIFRFTEMSVRTITAN